MSPPQQTWNIATLPQDVLIAILMRSCDIDSLLSSIATCRAFFDAFNSSQPSIIQALVFQEIDSALLPEAILAVKATSARNSHTPNSELPLLVSRLLSEDRAALVNYKWSVGDGIAAVRLHSVISKLAETFASIYLTDLGILSRHTQEHPGEKELARIKHSLYTFEIYSRLFPPSEESRDADLSAARSSFFSQFAPWENEQLASIHESLWRQITPAFNALALHDISWGKLRILFVTELGDLYTEEILSWGLCKIYSIACAETHARRYELLGGGDVPKAAELFLHEAFKDHNFLLLKSRDSTVTGDKPRQREAVFYDDQDPGPEKAWRWSHQEEDRMSLAKEQEYKSMRDCGYVFWDEKRLDCTGLLDKVWLDIDEVDEDLSSFDPSLEEQIKSWEERSALYRKGVRGYWEGWWKQ